MIHHEEGGIRCNNLHHYGIPPLGGLCVYPKGSYTRGGAHRMTLTIQRERKAVLFWKKDDNVLAVGHPKGLSRIFRIRVGGATCWSSS